MRNIILACSVLVLFVTAAIVVVTGPSTGAQDVLPTPKGQLGGPEPLVTFAPPGQQPSPTPPAPPTSTPATPVAGEPHPAECRVDARPIEDLILLADADAPPASPSTDGGIVADAATAGSVYATTHELVACLNAGDQLRAAALLTDDCLTRLLADTGWESGEIMSIIGPLLPRLPERWIQLTAVTDIQIVLDGRVSATVVLFDPERITLGPTSTHRVVFMLNSNRWLIDDISAR
jgi:hypothetical protein